MRKELVPIFVAALVIGALLGLVFLGSGCGHAPVPPPPPPPPVTTIFCGLGVEPVTAEVCINRWTVTGYPCAKCSGGYGCVTTKLFGSVYCVESNCNECPVPAQ